MNATSKPHVAFLPGGIQPVSIQYEPLLKVIGMDIQPLLKDLEVYADDTPPVPYTLSNEVEGLRRVTDKAGMERFHLVGYSGGGAVALAFSGRYPERVLSLVLSEPAVIPSQAWYRQEAAYWQQLEQVMNLPDPQLLEEFIRLELQLGVPMPPAPNGDQPPWMAKRPAGLKALVKAFSDYDLPYDRLKAFTQPVYLAVGALSNPVEMRKAEVLERLFPHIQIDVYAERHHFNPPQRAEAERFAQALIHLWEQAGSN